MRQVKFKPDELEGLDAEWWRRWSAKADRATAEAIKMAKEGKEPEFQSDIWSELKEFLLANVFYGLCGYCEAKITTVAFGDAEHYRPKGKVTTRVDGNARVVEIGGNPHPGYYWLAHHWRNLFPACGRCNTGAKMNHFPVEAFHIDAPDGSRSDPDDLDDLEKPYLLNPYRDNPSDYLRFDEFGGVSAVDGKPKGEHSIDVFGLMRADLVVERQREQMLAWLRIEKALVDGNVTAILDEYRDGRLPFSRAVLDIAEVRLRTIIRRLEEAIA